MSPAALFEEQAQQCLAVAAHHKPRLLAVAVKLAGGKEGGMELYQQTCLNCHNAIQLRGFTGDRYEFYLLKALNNLYYQERRQAARTLPLPATWEPAPACDAYAELAQQVQAEAAQRFTPAERIALRLYADGYSYQDIADLTGTQDRHRVRHQLDRLKDVLWGLFQQAYDLLTE